MGHRTCSLVAGSKSFDCQSLLCNHSRLVNDVLEVEDVVCSTILRGSHEETDKRKHNRTIVVHLLFLVLCQPPKFEPHHSDVTPNRASLLGKPREISTECQQASPRSLATNKLEVLQRAHIVRSAHIDQHVSDLNVVIMRVRFPHGDGKSVAPLTTVLGFVLIGFGQCPTFPQP